MKVSIITAVYNGASVIQSALDSIDIQRHKLIEHIVIDGLSTDGTSKILENNNDSRRIIIREMDGGIYDALNKGLAFASGEIIGVLHSDDFYADDSVLSDVVNIFKDPSINILYADLDYVHTSNSYFVIRKWRSGLFKSSSLRFGWMPPHPTVFVRRSHLNMIGNFDLTYRISADYDFLLRILKHPSSSVKYLPRVIVKMRMGGISNRSVASILMKTKEDLKILRNNNVGGIMSLFFKNIRKIPQFF